MKTILSICALVAAFSSNAAAWGSDGHQLVGMVAQQFLDANAASYVSKILDSTYSGQLGPAATWADSVKYTSQYIWSKPLHFADAMDSAPSSCGYVDTRDCKGNCIVSAITNYTSRLTCSNKFGTAAQDEALKFLTHFFGDITQPLHVENRDVGGNTDSVTFGGSPTNLHAVWDTSIPQQHMSNDFGNSLQTYADTLVQRLKSGEYAQYVSQWTSCVDPTKVGTTGTGDLDCPIQWAQDTNAFNCGPVVWNDYLSDTSADLSGKYYQDAFPIVDQQLAKGGIRLGLWLNSIFGACSGGTPTTSPQSSLSTSASHSATSSPETTPSTPSSTSSSAFSPTGTPMGSCTTEGEQLCIYRDGYSHLYKQCYQGTFYKTKCAVSTSYCYQTATESITCE